VIRCGLVFGVLGRIFARVIDNDDELSTVGRSTGFHCAIYIYALKHKYFIFIWPVDEIMSN
jgi:hypothetical protein